MESPNEDTDTIVVHRTCVARELHRASDTGYVLGIVVGIVIGVYLVRYIAPVVIESI
jgi:hypothetical protein